ncbi:hypothetical protein ACVI1L_003238 [Bradyrhizobium sp. USDA 4516]
MKCKRDADELGDNGQRVQYQEVDDAEGTPELAEALEDQARMADPVTAPSRTTISWLT